VGTDPFFVGWALKEYATANQIGNDDLAELLGCSKQALARLFLCRLPSDASPAFHSDIRHISEYAPCNADRLVRLIREVMAITRIGNHSKEDAGGFLLAARDRKIDMGKDDDSGGD
jgi:hypothetical protein